MSEKSPVSILQETCVKHSISPKFDLKTNNVSQNGNVFTYVANAFGICAEGSGLSKQLAKQNAAHNLLEQIKKSNINLNEVPESYQQCIEQKIDGVSTLTNMCITQNWPVPQFSMIDHSGPAHMPVFILKCSVGSYSAEGKSSTKKGAKNRAALLVLDIISNAIKDNPDDAIIEKCIPKPIEEIKEKYLRLTKRTQKNCANQNPTLSNRHRFFQSLDGTKIKTALGILCDAHHMNDQNISACEKVKLVLQLFNMTFELTNFGLPSKQFKLFELRGDYDCVFVGDESRIWHDIVGYLKHMLDIDLH